MLALLKYNYKIYRKCNKFIVPLLVFFIFEKIYYSGGTTDFISSMIICSNIVFFIMAWMGFSYCESQDWLTEQIIFLKVRNNNLYWISKVLFMWIIGIVLSLSGILLPLIANLLSDGFLFGNKVTFIDVLLAFFIHALATLMGLLLGMIFQTKVIGSRNISVIIIILSALLSIIKGPLIIEFPISKVVTWILPPIYNVTSPCIENGRFSLNLFIIAVIYSVVYILIQIFTYIKLMKKLLF